MADLLSDTLRALRLRGTIYFQADFASPWGMDFSASSVANFHLVVSGSCWFRGPEGKGEELHRGDAIVFPHGHPHQLASAPNEQVIAAPTFIETARREDRGQVVYGGEGDRATLICGHFELDTRGGHPLMSALPSQIVLRSGSEQEPRYLIAACELAVAEGERSGLGSSAIVDRLAEVALIEIIRAHALSLPEPAGFLAALADDSIATALAMMHREPDRAWTVEDLASEVAMSRSAFSDLFTSLVGIPPMRYLTLWRMHRARELLETTPSPIADVANCVGYQSEWAFAKAYKRIFGEGPGKARRAG